MTSKRNGIAAFPGFGAVAARLGVKRTKNNIQLVIPPLIASVDTDSPLQGGPSGRMEWVREADGRLVQQFISTDSSRVLKNGPPSSVQPTVQPVVEQPAVEQPAVEQPAQPAVEQPAQLHHPSLEDERKRLEAEVDKRMDAIPNQELKAAVALAGEAAQKLERFYKGAKQIFQSEQGQKGLESVELKEFLNKPLDKNQAYIEEANAIIKKAFPDATKLITNEEELLSFLAIVGPMVDADKEKQFALIQKIAVNADEAAKLAAESEKVAKAGLVVEKSLGKTLMKRLGSLVPYIGEAASVAATGIDTATLAEHPWNPLNWLRVGGDLASMTEIPGLSQVGTLVSGAVDVVDYVTAPEEYKRVPLNELEIRINEEENVDKRARYKVLFKEMKRLAAKIDLTDAEKQEYQRLFKEVADGVMKNKSSAV